MIKYWVNSKECQGYRGMTILEALLNEGIEIPHLCHDARLHDANRTCGLCVVRLEEEDMTVRSCATPLKDGMSIITDSPDLVEFRKVRMQQLLEDHYADCEPPCQNTCPAGIDIQQYLLHAKNQDFQSAMRTIMERNPFPSVCGRVCPHPCEAQCRRSIVDESININGVKRFVSDFVLDNEVPLNIDQQADTGKRIAIIGGGPSGLSAAYYSRLKGHDVTVFDKQEKMGGMMRYGIPDYRLPQDTLDIEIKRIEDTGVKLRPKKSLGMDLKLAEIQKEFDAVYFAVGSWQPTSMAVEGENLAGVWKGISFLERIAKGKSVKLGDHTVVIGGGNTAIDCARTALRLGSKVTLVYRRTQLEMPAEEEEIEEAMAEGIDFQFLTSPVRFEGDDENRVCAIECTKMELGEPDLSGRRRVRQVEDSNFSMPVNSVLLAIGQKTDTSYLWNDMPVKLNKWGDVEIDDATMLTSEDKIFAGGDCVTGPATVIQAIAAGRQASLLMDDYLTKGFVKRPVKTYSSSRGQLSELPKYAYATVDKAERLTGTLDFTISAKDAFKEVKSTMSQDETMTEASRCLECGCDERKQCTLRNEATLLRVSDDKTHAVEHRYPIVEDHPLIIRDANKCISCGKCVSTCKEVQGVDALDFYFKQGKIGVGTKHGNRLEDSACISCGQCVIACPCGALSYKSSTTAVSTNLNKGKKSVAFVAPAVRTVMAKYFDLPASEVTQFMAGALKTIGFDYVYDFTFAADLTIVEETNEFLKRVEKGALPHFTSCCPGWISHVEKSYPEAIPFLSSCKSPQQMMGALVKEHLPGWLEEDVNKEDLFVVSIVPCVAKKGEADREEFVRDSIKDVDEVLTTDELIKMIQSRGLTKDNVDFMEFDKPYRMVSGAGILFGMTGGVAEASLRMAVDAANDYKTENLEQVIEYEQVRGMEGIKMAKVPLGDMEVKLAVVNGIRNAAPIVEELIKTGKSQFDLIEVMSCPGGCVSGAGHPAPKNYSEVLDRQNVLIEIDQMSENRKSHTNPDIQAIYETFIDKAGEHKVHEMFHTHYTDRRVTIPTEGHKEESAWETRNIDICICEDCYGKGSSKLIESTNNAIKSLDMDHFFKVRPVMLSGHTKVDDIFVFSDNKIVEKADYEDMENWLKNQ